MECIKQVSNFTNVATNLKFDLSKFDAKHLEKILPEASPKLETLFENIDKIDPDKKYKHCIYVDFKGTYAKIVAGAFLAKGYNLAYDKHQVPLTEKELLKKKGKNFLFLSSSAVYGKPFGVRVRKNLMSVFNRRPDNVEGDLIRFIILDSGFREGLDCFDIKYVHILQNLVTHADEKQAIGRSTRLCGQRGLVFDPKKGWELHVYKYDVTIPDRLQEVYNTDSLFKLFINTSRIDLRKIVLASELEKLITEVAVDRDLTKNIHDFAIDSKGGARKLLKVQHGVIQKQKKKGHPRPLKVKRTLNGVNKFVNENFGEYKWDKVKLENKCVDVGGSYDKPEIMEFTPSQNFLRYYFQPESVYKGVLVDHSTGAGKCHAKDTPIIMYDGTIKMVQDIKIGDQLMGDDSTPRTVLSLAEGEDDLYDINPIKGDKYTVNSEHILCLKPTKLATVNIKNQKLPYNARYINIKTGTVNGKSFKTKEEANEFLDKLYTSDYIYEVSVKDYLKLSKCSKRLLKGYRVGVEFKETQIDFDPYIIGLWLGDGSTREPVITIQDSTVLYYLHTVLYKYDLSLNYQSNYNYRISSYSGNIGSNKLLEALKKYNLLNNKHIPKEYKINSRYIRLQLLAGLIDSDGYADKKGYEITQKNKVLANDILYLARSLGYAAYISECQKSCFYKGEKKTGTYNRITISGDKLYEVPVKIPRKKLEARKQIKDTGITVTHIGRGNYYGFTLNGNNRYLLGDFTVTHNTCTAVAVASTSWERKGYTILWVTRHTLKADIWKNMFDQVCSLVVKSEIEKGKLKFPLKKAPFNYTSSAWVEPISFKQLSNLCEGKNEIYRQMVKRNGTKDPLRKTFIILDEAHKLFATDVVGSERPNTPVIIDAINNSYRISKADSVRILMMTATPITGNPMDFIKLMNIIREDKLPESFEEFSEEYLLDNGVFKESPKEKFADLLAGQISYLNREKDIRQFAYPVYHTINVPLSESEVHKFDAEIVATKMEQKETDTKIENAKQELKNTKIAIREFKADKLEDCKKIPVKERADCKEKIKNEISRIQRDRLKHINDKIIESEIRNKELNTSIKKLEKDKKQAILEDTSQENALKKCMRKVIKEPAINNNND